MLNLIIKSAALSVGTKLVHEFYPSIKETITESYDAIYDFLLGESSKETHSSVKFSNPKSKVSRTRHNITKAQYAIILKTWEYNKSLPKKDRVYQDVLTKKLNDALNLTYTRSGYLHLVNKRVIPKDFNNE